MSLLDARRLNLIDGGRGVLLVVDSMGSVRMMALGRPVLWHEPIDWRPQLDLRASAYPRRTVWSPTLR